MAMEFVSFNRALIVVLLLLFLSYSARGQWLNHGRDLWNSRYASEEMQINRTSVAKLHLRWQFVAGFDVSATPAIADGVVYFPSWNGNLYAVSATSGSLIWMKNLTQLTGIEFGDNQRGANSTLSRSTPTVAGDKLIVGLYGPAVVVAVNRFTGSLLWMKQLDFSPGGVITMSGTAYKRGFYVGTSSVEENFPDLCCTFQGSFLKLDTETGNILWQTLMLPPNNGSQGLYSGAPIWGSSPAVDVKRNHVYIATGNVYDVPPAISKCQEEQNNKTTPDVPNPCIEADNHEESILALDLDTGNIKWYNQLGGYDAWVASCNTKPVSPNCPTGPNPDYDFSDCPSMLTIWNGTNFRDIVVAGQKSGNLWALDCDDGKLVWSAVTGPGGGGGQIWGTATDAKSIYVNVPNSRHKNWTLSPTDRVVTDGGWCAVNASNGEILWSVTNPTRSPVIGPVSLVNGVVLGGSMDAQGSVFALDAATGSILWSSTTNATVYGGFSIHGGCAYIGSGASVNVGPGYNGTRGDSLFAYCLTSP